MRWISWIHPRGSETFTIPIITIFFILWMFIVFSHILSEFLASSWGHMNRLGSSYVTQASPFWLAGWESWEVETWKSATSPSPPGGGGHSCFPAGSVSNWLERASHSKSEWRRPIPLRQLNRPGRSYVTFFTCSMFSYRNIHFIKKCLKKKR